MDLLESANTPALLAYLRDPVGALGAGLVFGCMWGLWRWRGCKYKRSQASV